MNIDFHVHGLLSKRKDFNEKFFLSEVRYAKENNIDGIVLCEHFNADNYRTIYKYLHNNYAYEGSRYIVEGISIFPAMEVSVKNKGHVIISGDREDIMTIYEELAAYMIKENLINLEQLLDLAEVYGCLKIGAHPFRRGHKLCKQQIEQLKRLDAIDLNAKDIYKKGQVIAKDELIQLSRDIGVNIVTGSDSHTPLQLGSVVTSFENNLTTINEIKADIVAGRYNIEINNSLDFKVYSSKILKRYLISTGSYTAETNFII